MGVEEYGGWVDKLMTVRHIDAARTTNLPALDVADVLGPWYRSMNMDVEPGLEPARDPFDEEQPVREEPSPPIPSGTRISVYWTEMEQWFDGTVTSSRLETGDDGQRQRATHVQYDPFGTWRSTRQLSYWHCLDDEHWQFADEGASGSA